MDFMLEREILDIVFVSFFAIAIGLINKAYGYKNDEMNVKELVMLIIPSCGVIGYGILQYYLNVYEKDTEKSLIRYLWILWSFLSFVHYFISIIAILVMTTMFQKLEGGAGRTDRAGAGIKSGQ